jgi:VIT1/CCC1 family predicted Fe2+/Mn2+ transporter
MAGDSLLTRIKESLTASAGEVVFGMSDGTVSILGLVLGVAAGADSADAVVLAGATGAIAASVSMMAGCFMEIESERDEAEIETRERIEEIARNPEAAVQELVGLLQDSGLSQESISSIEADITKKPVIISGIETAIAASQEPVCQKTSPVVHSIWMFLSDLFAGLTPVIPFVLFPMHTAWIICIAVTTVLLLLLGLGRARISNRSPARTVAETMGIALAAALAGVIVGILLSG